MTKAELDRISGDLADLSAKHKEAVAKYRAEHGEPNWKKLVGNYYRFSKMYFRAIGAHDQGLSLLYINHEYRHDSDDEFPIVQVQKWTWPVGGLREDMTEVSPKEYSNAVGPVLSEILKLAGTTRADFGWTEELTHAR